MIDVRLYRRGSLNPRSVLNAKVQHITLPNGVVVPVLDVDGKILECGTFTGTDGNGDPATETYTKQDLQGIADNFDPPSDDLHGWTVPITKDHSDKQDGVTGHIRKVWRQGDQLNATFRYVGDDNIKDVQEGRIARNSSGLRPSGNEDKPYKLDHVTNTPFPAAENCRLNSRKGPQKMDNDDDSVDNARAKDDADDADDTEDDDADDSDKKDDSDDDDEDTRDNAKSKSDCAKMSAKKLARANKDLMVELARARAEGAKHLARAQSSEKSAEEQKAEMVDALVDGWVKSSLSRSHMAKVEKMMLSRMAPDGIKEFKAYKEAQGPLNPFSQGIRGVQSATKPEDEPGLKGSSQQSEDARVKELLKFSRFPGKGEEEKMVGGSHIHFLAGAPR